jgi:hypothetical protein
MKKIVRLTESDLIKLVKRVISESDKDNIKTAKTYPSFYSSNFDKHIKPQRKGWYVGYITKSGDIDFMMVDRKPIDKTDAKRMLQEINPDEIYSFITKIVEVE